MPIKHHETAGVEDTSDIQQSGGVDLWLPIERVFEHGNGNPVIWERAPAALWGLYYPTAPGATNPHPLLPTGPELVAMNLQGMFEITGSPKPSFVISPANNEADWFSTGTSATFFLATARLFVLVRQGVGTVTDIINEQSQMTQFQSFVEYDGVVMNGTTYNGRVTRETLSIFDGNTPYRVFVS
jgi:hypothetical protein